MEHRATQTEDREAVLAIRAARSSLVEFAVLRGEADAKRAEAALIRMENAVNAGDVAAVRVAGQEIFAILCREA